MILGIGSDIIEISRVNLAIQRQGQRFLDRLFSQEEQDYCHRHQESARHFSGRFAAKEATVKALGTGFREGITWLDIVISNDHHGKPIVTLSPALQEMFHSPIILISISHCKEYAMAFATHTAAP